MWLRSFVVLTWALALLVSSSSSSSFASARIVRHKFDVGSVTLNRLCRNQAITAVNGGLPGPAVVAREGDTLVVRVNNKSPYNVTIHWHGVFQLMNAWADGPEYVTQCPIRPGQSYTYRFNVTKQEGTLLWHAHFKSLRATVHGAIIIRPAPGRRYPFPTPFAQIPVVLGEWYNANIMDIDEEAVTAGRPPNISNAYTINGQPGDLYPCSSNNTVKFAPLVPGKTYLLRVINAALNTALFFKISHHKFTVVAVDASYTEPYATDLLVLSPGQTVDALMTADQLPTRRYYMAASAYVVPIQAPFVNISATAVVSYVGPAAASRSLMPAMPDARDNRTGHRFLSNLTGLTTSPHWVPVPRQIDERMFITTGLGLTPCDLPGGVCAGPNQQKVASSMNNVSFELPTRLSIMEAYVNNVSGIYTADFPDSPPVTFDYTNPSNTLNPALLQTVKATRVKKFKFNATVEMVFQNTAVLSADDHPMHIHGLSFHVVAQGFGNYNPATDGRRLNLVNPQERNTVVVPALGWVVIRFRANNPGVWLVHCHIDAHVPWGLANAFIIEDGPTPATRLPPPPADLPKC